MKLKGVEQLDVGGKRVLIRCDFNVPLKDKKILDDFRIRAVLPTINFLIEKKAKLILISHLGKPKGKVVEELRLEPIAKRLEELLKRKVLKLKESIGKETERIAASLKEKEILLLENIRFYLGEELNDFNFAKSLANLGDVFVNEAFSVSHRSHASVLSLPKLLPAGVGFLFKREVENLEKFLKEYKRPLVAIIGGKKFKDKAPLVEKFSKIGDWVLVNHLIGREIEQTELKNKIKNNVVFPVDGIEEKDIGEKTIKIFKEKISEAQTIFWNGPLGQIEEEKYQGGTKEIALAILEKNCFSLIGGGETIEFTNKLNITQKFSFASTGGGAMLKFLAGEKLPGLEVLGYYGN
jgi:phosphoglycerate kinase